ncbi:MAG: hypothetical protein CW338_07010 [Clostridiales bacterium]|nr:hypothetical protein [Clostridiales bacterium]
MKDKGKILFIGYIVVLFIFTAYIIFDTFVFSTSYMTDAVEVNMALFEQQPDSSSPDSAGTPASSEQNTAADNESTEPNASSDNRYSRENPSYPGGKNSRRNDTRDSLNRYGGRNSSYSGSVSPEKGEISGYASDMSYQDDNISITLTEYREYNSSVYVADIVLSSAQYLKTAFARNTYGRNVTAETSSIARSNDAILAINGDYYGAQEKGYVIRNGIVYRNTPKGTDVLCIYADGTAAIISDLSCSAEELVQKGVWQAFTFGPALVENGSVTVGTRDEVSQAMTSNPRTAIGLIDNNHFVFVVSDGRTNQSEGLTLYELAQFMKSLGVMTAYNLDGGGSSTMYFNGQVINNPTTNGRISERSVSDIVYIR